MQGARNLNWSALVMKKCLNEQLHRKIQAQFDELLEERQMLHDFFMQAPATLAILKGAKHIFELANPTFIQLFGGRSVVGKTIREALPELEGQEMIKLLDNVYKTGKPYIGTEIPATILRKNGNEEQGYFNFIYQAITDKKGETEGVMVFAVEVTQQIIARKKVEESADRIRLIGEAMPEKVWTANAEGNVTYMNQRWIDYTGKTYEELKDWGWQTVIHPEDFSTNHQSWLYSIETGIPFEIEHRLLQKNGIYRWHLSRGVAQKDKNGKTVLWVGTNTDIDDQKLAEEAIQKNQVYTRSLIEASLDPLITISPEGKITDVNEATEDVTGIPRDQLIGTHFFYHFTDPVKASKGYQKVFSKGFVEDYPLTIRHKKGKLTPVLFNGSVYKDEQGQVLGIVVIARDITQLIKNEKELLQAKNNAEQAAELARGAVRSKQQFLSTMSHEIRTPLNAIIGFTQVILKTKLNPTQKEYLTTIQKSGDTLLTLINDILDLAKVEAGKMTFENIPMRLTESITDVLHTFEIKAQEKNLQMISNYDVNIPEVLLGDPVRLHQIILNLVNNAIKFTAEGTISINASLSDQTEQLSFIEFTISDTGIGIPEDKLHDIFENFQQASSDTARNYGGTGLGLSIVKKLVEGQGGKLSVSSKVNEGSQFCFRLPFKKQKGVWNEPTITDDIKIHEKEFSVNTSITSNLLKNKLKVLVVEDNKMNQRLMKALLTDFGFEYDIADNGKIAIEKSESNTYDIILMDLQMPEMNGIETTDYIRSKIKSQIPIILLTADVTTMDEEKCKAAGMNDYIAKPVNEKVLYNKMISLLEQNQSISL